MSYNLPKYQANYSSIVAYVDRDQLTEQDGHHVKGDSPFKNSHTDSRSRNIARGDIAFKWMPKFGNRAYCNGMEQHYNKFVTTLTGLKRVPYDDMQQGIEEVKKAKNLNEDTVRMSLLANMQILGFVMDDFKLEDRYSEANVDIAIQITGIFTIHTYEDIYTGAHVRAVVPSSSLFNHADWGKDRAKPDRGRITLVPTAATEYDIWSYTSLIMNEFMHHNGTDSLAFVRSQRSFNMFVNLAHSFNEFVLTCAILGVVAFAEQGLVKIPRLLADNNVGIDIGTAAMDQHEILAQLFGRNHEGNNAAIYYDKNLAAGDVRYPRNKDEVKVLTPSDLGVFLGIVTGLLDEPGRGNSPYDIENRVDSTVYHARKVASSPDYEKEMEGVKRAVYRLLAMVTATNGEQGDFVQEEFGAPQFGDYEHAARELHDGITVSPIKQGMYGKMLRQQYHAAPSFILSLGNIVQFNLHTYLGTCIRGATKGNQMSLYIRS